MPTSRSIGGSTRFLPRSLTNDELSRNLSREHVAMQLTNDGFKISDLDSRMGSTLDGHALTSPQLLTASDSEEKFRLAMACGSVDTPFHTEVEIFSERSGGRLQSQSSLQWDFESLDIAPSRLNRLSLTTQVRAVRIRRLNNLAGREEYVLVFGPAQVGTSNQTAITLVDRACDPLAALLHHTDGCFWMQSTATKPIQIDGRSIALNEWVPLVVGMRIAIGQTEIEFRQCQQMYIHDG